MKDQNGQEINLKQFLGKNVILYFYPKDLTPGCTAEACNYRDNYEMLTQKGFVVIGVSADNESKHRQFIVKHELPFTLVADTEKQWINSFGVWGPKKFMGRTFDGILRTTFIINPEGIITHVIKKVDTKNSTQQVLDLIS